MRMRALAPPPPRSGGRGTTGARAASEPWWRGRWTRSFVAVAGQCHQASLNNFRSEMIRSSVSSACSRHRRNDVAARAPSTTLLRRVVPLPRYRGAGRYLLQTAGRTRALARCWCVPSSPSRHDAKNSRLTCSDAGRRPYCDLTHHASARSRSGNITRSSAPTHATHRRCPGLRCAGAKTF